MSPPAMDKVEDNKSLVTQTNSLHTDGSNVDPTEARFTSLCKVLISLTILYYYIYQKKTILYYYLLNFLSAVVFLICCILFTNNTNIL